MVLKKGQLKNTPCIIYHLYDLHNTACHTGSHLGYSSLSVHSHISVISGVVSASASLSSTMTLFIKLLINWDSLLYGVHKLKMLLILFQLGTCLLTCLHGNVQNQVRTSFDNTRMNILSTIKVCRKMWAFKSFGDLKLLLSGGQLIPEPCVLLTKALHLHQGFVCEQFSVMKHLFYRSENNIEHSS